jgi:hypothetical protein
MRARRRDRAHPQVLRAAALVLCTIVPIGACAPAGPADLSIGTPSPSATAATAPTASPPSPSPTDAPLTRSPTLELYLPYLAKTLGGPDGWETPFIIQNADVLPTDLELDFYRISDGAPVAHEVVNGLRPGRSYANRPNQDPSLPGNTAFSAVIRSYGAKVVAVVNEQRGAGARFEADSYVSQIGGRQGLFVPTASRGVDGFFSTIVVQNVDAEPTDLKAEFLSATGGVVATVTRHLLPGRSGIIELSAERGLADGASYSVRMTAPQRLAAIVSSQRDRPSDPAPMVYLFKALGDADRANIVYGPYAVKNVPGVGGGTSAITVQNLATLEARPTLHFVATATGSSVSFDGPTLAPGASWTFDTRFRNGDQSQGPCGPGPAAGCLADGELSFSVGAPGGQFAALATAIGPTTATAYTAMSRPADFFLPNVTRTLGGAQGWTTPIIVQSVTASRLTVSWFRFGDGQLVTTQTLSVTPERAIRIDPRSVAELSDDTQYAVLVEGNGGRLVAVVLELNFQGGDGAAIYEGFFR